MMNNCHPNKVMDGVSSDPLSPSRHTHKETVPVYGDPLYRSDSSCRDGFVNDNTSCGASPPPKPLLNASGYRGSTAPHFLVEILKRIEFYRTVIQSAVSFGDKRTEKWARAEIKKLIKNIKVVA
jgi:hypothetical protein